MTAAELAAVTLSGRPSRRMVPIKGQGDESQGDDDGQARVHDDRRWGLDRLGRGGVARARAMSSVFGVTLDDLGVSLTRLLGASYLGYAAIAWFARDVTDHAAARAIALGGVASWAISAVVTVTGIVSGLAGAQAWLLVAVEAAFAAAWGYFELRRSDGRSHPRDGREPDGRQAVIKRLRWTIVAPWLLTVALFVALVVTAAIAGQHPDFGGGGPAEIVAFASLIGLWGVDQCDRRRNHCVAASG